MKTTLDLIALFVYYLYNSLLSGLSNSWLGLSGKRLVNEDSLLSLLMPLIIVIARS